MSQILEITVWVHQVSPRLPRKLQEACEGAFPFRDWWHDPLSQFLEGRGWEDTARAPREILLDLGACVWPVAKRYLPLEVEVCQERVRGSLFLRTEEADYQAYLADLRSGRSPAAGLDILDAGCLGRRSVWPPVGRLAVG